LKTWANGPFSRRKPAFSSHTCHPPTPRNST
jgi:hypothetical protein